MLIAVKNNLEAYIVDTDSCLEILWVALRLPPRVTCIIGVCYRPPDASGEFPEFLNESLTFIQNKWPSSSIFLAGDFNYPAIEWHSYRPIGSSKKRECQSFLDVLSSFDLHQVVSDCTRGNSLLDLVLTTEPNSVSVTVLDGVSDHSILHCELICECKTRDNTKKIIFDYARANVDMLIGDLSSFFRLILCNPSICAMQT